MAKIKKGGQLLRTDSPKLETLSFNVDTDCKHPRHAEMWINNRAMSYVSIDELLTIKEEINQALNELIN